MAFLGMRDSGDYISGTNPRYTWRPENWREMILHENPNGRAPLTAILSMMGSQKTDDPIFHWFEKALPDQRGVVTGVYTNTGLSSAYTAHNLGAGDMLYIKMSAANAGKFRKGYVAVLQNSASAKQGKHITGFLTAAPTIAGANSYLSFQLAEADGTGESAAGLNLAYVTGNANAEGADTPNSLLFDPTPHENYTQIFRDSLEHSRTALKTRLRTGDAVKEAKRETLEMHSVGIEKALIFGVKYNTAVDGKPLRMTAGLRSLLTTNVSNFATQTGMTSWASSGENWLNEYFEKVFRYGSSDKIMLCGSGALLGIQKIAKAGGNFQLTSKTTDYGISILNWITPFGTIAIKTHPLFSYEPTLRNSALIVEPKLLVQRILDDTAYKPERQANGIDGEASEYITELGLEVHFEKAHGWLDGIGLAPTS